MRIRTPVLTADTPRQPTTAQWNTFVGCGADAIMLGEWGIAAKLVLCQTQGLGFNAGAGKGVGHQKCEAPAGPFRLLVSDTFSRTTLKLNVDKALAAKFHIAWLMVLMLAAAGCHTPRICCEPGFVSQQLSCRTGVKPETVAPCRQVIPPGVQLDDGLSEDEAVHTALSNNSAYQSTLAQLGMVGGDSLQASLIANPQVLMYFPAGAKEGQYTLYAPIESYLLRPARVKVANREYRRVGEQLVQNGLNLARDVRLAHADFVLAAAQAQLAQEALAIRQDIVALTNSRLQKGDISELETIAAKVDSLNATALAGVQQQAVSIAEARLATLIGLPLLDTPLTADGLIVPTLPPLEEQTLVSEALACRPDYHAASWAVAAASERSRLSRFLFWRVDGVLDVRDGPGYTHNGGGLRFDLPIFNRNQGGVLRADWELNAAQHTRDAIRDQIVQDVRIAVRQLQQAHDNLTILNRDIAPALIEALEISKKGFADGGTDYLLVLQTTSQYLDARARILDQTAACRRALAELERSVGHSLSAGPIDVQRLIRQTAPATEIDQAVVVAVVSPQLVD